MATKRHPPTKKHPSPPPKAAPHPDNELEVEERSSSEEDPEEELGQKSSESGASDDEDEGGEDGGDESDEDDSESSPPRATPNPPRALAVAAPSSDDEESDESGEEDSGSEREKPNLGLQKSSIARPDANGKPSQKKSEPASESEEEDLESEEEEDERKPTTRNHVAARPSNADGNPADKKPLPESESEEEDSESEEEQRTPSLLGSTVARTPDAKGSPSDKESVPVSKSGNVAASPKSAMGDTAKKLFQRIWSDDDQIALLQGMVEYVDVKGKDPAADIKDFWLFIRNKLSFPVTELQLMTKIRSVRKKYRSNQTKDRTFSKAYDAKVFDLSKKVWGATKKNPAAMKRDKAATENGENGGDKKRKITPVDKEAVLDSPSEELTEDMLWKDGFIDLCKEHFGWDEYSAWAKVNSMDESEMKSFEPLWKKLKTEEIGSFERRRLLEFESLGTIF